VNYFQNIIPFSVLPVKKTFELEFYISIVKHNGRLFLSLTLDEFDSAVIIDGVV
jgi:hypothetical protein